ncbi:MAG: MBL fold metallo-hydrolase [Acidobacteriota bacterium]
MASPLHAVTLRYLGHSSFLFTSSAGTRVVIDPYTSGEWPGLVFPSVHADRVLITHPHWDHDAWRQVQGKPKVTRGPGPARKLRGFAIEGIAGRHARTAGAAIDFVNTVFVIETDGVRFCHLGDNAPLREVPGLAGKIGAVDVLMMPIDSEKRVLTYDQVEEWIEALAPRVVIPMHYRIPGLAFEHVTGLGTVDEWLASLAEGVPLVRLPAGTITLGPGGRSLPPPGSRSVWVFTLSGQTPPKKGPPPARETTGREIRRQAEAALTEGDTATALKLLKQAASLDPGDGLALQEIGFLYLGSSRPDRALEFFERGARVADKADPHTASLCWLGAGMALDVLGRREEALAAYREVIAIGLNDELQADTARRYLERPYEED